MPSYIVYGGNKLEGELSVSGSKNACLPILAASILNKGVTKLYNVPNIHDTQITLKILKILGCKVDKKNGKIMRKRNSDEYYVKYSITTTRQYHYFRGVTYADINGMITTKEKESPSRVWNITIGPVKKGFRASIQYNEGGTCQIEVSKNNGPFALKAEGKNSASYTIDF
mgnify:CR=1 FL=1